MEKERDEQIIYFKDLFFIALYQWRRMLAAGLALCLVLGGLSVVSQLQGRSPAQQQEQQVNSQAQRELENQLKYSEESLLMNLNPYNLFAATLEMTVDSGFQIRPGATVQDPDTTETLLYAYRAQFQTEAVSEEIAQVIGVESKYLQELMQLTLAGTARSMQITVFCADRETGEKLLQSITDILPTVQERVSESVGEHKITVLASCVRQTVDQELAKKQTDTWTRIAELRKKQEQTQIVLTTGDDTDISVKKVLVMAALGFIAGAGLVACWAWAKYIFGGRVYSRRTLENATGVKLIAQIGTKAPKNKLDRLLMKLEGRIMENWEDQTAMVAAYLRNCYKEQGPLLLTGDCSPEQIARLAQSLQESGVAVTVCGSLLREPEALEVLTNCSGVLLVEQTEVSKYRNIEQQIATMQEMNKPLLGCVLLDI